MRPLSRRVSCTTNRGIFLLRSFNVETSPSKLLLLEDIVNPLEEEVLVDISTKILARKRYEGNHWDDVIIKYKEVDFGQHFRRLNSTDDNVKLIKNVLVRLTNRIQVELKREKIDFQSPHVIDLAPDGWIGPHVDSVKFSGDLIAGLSLGAERKMVMTKEKVDDDLSSDSRKAEYSSMPERYEFRLKRRSLYIMTGLWRYYYNHEITKSVEADALTNRRISIIFRNEKPRS